MECVKFFFKKYRGYWKSKIGICLFKARKFSAVRSLITILYPLEDEDKSVNCFVVIMLDYSESFVNMVFGNFLGFLKEDDGCWRDC